MGLYLPSGFINQNYIAEEAKRINAAFVVEVGARQIGKTYGSLQRAVNNGKPFILMRRTKDEAKFICNGAVNPFLALGDPDIYCKSETEYTGGIYKNDVRIGMIMSLNSVAKVRGFYGQQYTDLIFDEFIPESHVYKIKNEGDAFLNAIVTISGNRELNGEPPLLTWLLSNSNNIASPILSALNLTDKIESMIKRGQEFSALPERGVIIVLPKSEQILAKRQHNAIVKAAGSESKFYQMAFENRFAYNDPEHVGQKPLSDYKPILAIIGKFTIYQRKGLRELYVTQYRKCKREYADNDRGLREMLLYFPEIKLLYTTGCTYFQSMTIKQLYLDTLHL